MILALSYKVAVEDIAAFQGEWREKGTNITQTAARCQRYHLAAGV